ncbi:MAG: hypothetical protein U0X87_10455 [Anaerolineales bacterium]
MSTPPIFWIAAARTRAAPTVSRLFNAESETMIASSAPMAACLSASFADSGPIHNAVTVEPLTASLSAEARLPPRTRQTG